jgi:hypothetical protein
MDTTFIKYPATSPALFGQQVITAKIESMIHSFLTNGCRVKLTSTRSFDDQVYLFVVMVYPDGMQILLSDLAFENWNES